MQDVTQIKKELQGFQEIDISYPLNKQCFLHYITLDNDEEFFYKGGYFSNYAFNKIIIINDKNKKKSFPIHYKDKVQFGLNQQLQF